MISILLDHLQKIEAGLLQELTPELEAYIVKFKKHPSGGCPVCRADILVRHHIKTYKRQRDDNGSEKGFLELIGEIWICPNCHARVHIENPYFKRRKYTVDPDRLTIRYLPRGIGGSFC